MPDTKWAIFCLVCSKMSQSPVWGPESRGPHSACRSRGSVAGLFVEGFILVGALLYIKHAEQEGVVSTTPLLRRFFRWCR